MPNYDTFKSFFFASSLIIILLPLWMVLQNRPSQNNGKSEGTKFNFTLPHAINNLPSNNQKSSTTTLIIVFTDISYLSATKKWISRMEGLGYQNVRIYALEKLAFQELKKLNLIYEVQYHNTEYEIGLKPRNKADILESYKDPERKLRVKRGERYKIWRIRLEVTKRILKEENFSVIISDIDSIWTRFVDLENDYFNNFDVIHSLGYKMPEWILEKQGFVLCGCFVYYKNTAETLKFIEAYNYACKTTLCDDQILLNELYFKNNVSLQNDFKPAQNTRNSIGIWTSSGKREISMEEYLKFVKTCDCSSFDAYSDSDTINGSKKRLQKSVENTLKWTAECVKMCKEDFSSILGKMCAIVPGGNDYRRRQQSIVGLRKIEDDSFQFKYWILENVEIDSAVEIYKKCLELLPKNAEVVISFCKKDVKQDNLKIFKVIEDCLKLKKCVFQTNAFFHLADGYLGVKEKGEGKSEIDASGEDGPPIKKLKTDSTDEFEIMDFSDAKQYKLDTDTYLLDGYSNAYIHHLQDTGEFLGKTLLVINNLTKLVRHCNKL